MARLVALVKAPVGNVQGGMVYCELSHPSRGGGVLGVAMLIISAAALFSCLISLSKLLGLVGSWSEENFCSALTFLLVMGMCIETSAAILVLAPILTSVAIGFGIDPVHFGIVIVASLPLGMITPPLGLNLFAAAEARAPVQRCSKRWSGRS